MKNTLLRVIFNGKICVSQRNIVTLQSISKNRIFMADTTGSQRERYINFKIMGAVVIFGMIAVVVWSILAWTYTEPGKRWLKTL